MARVELPLDAPLDLVRTLRPLARGSGDASLWFGTDEAWLALRVRGQPTTFHVRHLPGRVVARSWGAGADGLAEWLPALLGLRPGTPSTSDLLDAPDRIVRDLARRLPGIRTPATWAVLDALIPAVLEQKVTGDEARRAWRGLIRAHGAPAPRPDPPSTSPIPSGPDVVPAEGPPAGGLRLSPPPTTLARLPYYAFHPFGVERRRAEVIRAIASRAAWFEAIVDLPLPEAHTRLRSVPGIGPWTAAEVAVRALGDVDAVSVGDFHLPHLVAWVLAGEPRGDDARMLDLLAPYAGRRALVVRLLEASGLRAPRYGPRLASRRIEGL